MYNLGQFWKEHKEEGMKSVWSSNVNGIRLFYLFECCARAGQSWHTETRVEMKS